MHTRAYKQKSTQNFNITNSIEVTIIGVARGGAAPPIEVPSTTKNVTKKACFFQFRFLLASLRTTVHAYHSN